MRYAIGVPHTRLFEGPVVDSLLTLQKPQDGFEWIRVPDLPVDEARNEIVKRFLAKEDLQYLLMMDSDMVAHPASLARLAQRLGQPGVDMVGALCFTRYRPPVPSLFAGVSRKQWRLQKEWPFLYRRDWLWVQIEETYNWLHMHPEAQAKDPIVLDPAPEDSMVIAHATGGAFCLFKRECFATISPPWFKRDDLKKGEDFHYFQRARRAGLKLWIDRSVIVHHMWGDQALGPLDFLAYQEQRGLRHVST